MVMNLTKSVYIGTY